AGAGGPSPSRHVVHARLPRVRGPLRRDGGRGHPGPQPRGAARAAHAAGRLPCERAGARPALPRGPRVAAMMWIEVLNREGDVVARERIPADEARIGRAFDNDVVLSDPHVAPHHLRVSRAGDGTLVAEDLGTINGL